MSENEKKVPILKWAMELESLKALLLVFILLCFSNGCRPASTEPPASLSGRWTGSGVHRGRTIPVIMDFYETPDGWRAFGGKAGLPDYLFRPARNIRYQHPHLNFEIQDGPEHMFFEGKVSGKTINGAARNGEQMGLDLRWTGDAPPLPFTEEAIEIRNGEVKLAGNLLLPPGPGPHPAIVLIHGSGRQSRDSLRILGDLFVRHGVAALFYDKRDVGANPIGVDLVDLRDLAGDALAAVALLKARDDIRNDQIGLWGGSQGGWVAPIAAAQSGDVAFIIGVSAPGVSVAEVWLFQAACRLRGQGFSDREVSEAMAAGKRLDDFVRSGNRTGAQAMIEEARHKRWFGSSSLTNAAPTETELRTWIRWRNLDFDPVSYWERVKVPVLLIYGEREDRVPVDPSVERIREAFRRAGNTRHTIKVFPGADHNLMLTPNPTTSEKGSVGTNEGPNFAPGYLDTMTEWLREQLGLAR